MSATTTEKTVDELREEAAAATERMTAIRLVCNGEHGEIEARAIREGWNQQRVELEVLRASRPKAPFIHSARMAPTRHVIEAAILSHMGHESLAEEHLGPQAAQQALRPTECSSLLTPSRRPPGVRSSIKSANDFKDHTGVRPSQTGDLEEVAPCQVVSGSPSRPESVSTKTARLGVRRET